MEFLSQMHPKIIHYPVALFAVYALLEIIGALFKKDFFSKSAHLILFLGLIGAIIAVLTGNSAAEALQHLNKIKSVIPGEAVNAHMEYANYTLWYFAGLLVLRTFIVLNKKFSNSIKYLFLILSLIGVLLIYKTGELGGKLVYKYGAGTDLIRKELNNGQSAGSYRDKIFKGKQE
ncbi:MAG: DUF2231 domain-containing protein [Ignavibacteriaceae bacterium]